MPTTVCHVCDTTEDRAVGEHLAEHHLNEFFEMEHHPDTDETVIWWRVADPVGP